MRLEDVPVLFGILAALAGAIVIADAWTPDSTDLPFERRRHPRPERSRAGEGIFGGALLVLALALFGGDRWRFTTLAIVIAFILAVVGVVLNARYFKGLVVGPGRGKGLEAGDQGPGARG
ncbi:MAG TPA: hypothetical protein VF041_09260 [Gemmatimonadaceae bacterium]